jgi:transcriptional regulator with XRE-family HTH domain
MATLIEIRNNLELTQRESAKKIGVQQGTYCHWESGKKIPRSLSKLHQLARAFDLTLDEAIGLFDVKARDFSEFGDSIPKNTLEISERLGVSRNIVQQWQKGIASPSIVYAIELSKLLGVSVEEIYKRLQKGQLT